MTAEKRRQTVVYIEDRKEDIMLFERVAKQHFPNVNFEIISESEKAFKEINDGTFLNRTPKVVIIDINMPKVSGFDLLEKFNECLDEAQFPKVVFSSSTRPLDIKKAMQYNCNSFIEKPNSYKEYKEVLTKTLSYWLEYNLN